MVEVVPVAHQAGEFRTVRRTRRLDGKRAAAMHGVVPARNFRGKRGGIHPHHRQVVVEGPDQGPLGPVPPKDGEDAGVDHQVRSLIGESPGCLRLAPEIDAHRQAQAAEISIKDLEPGPGGDPEALALQVPQGAFALAAEELAGPVKKGGGVIAAAPAFFHQPGHQVRLKLPGGPAQGLIPGEGKIFREADEIGTLTPAALQEFQGPVHVLGAVQLGCGERLNQDDFDQGGHCYL